MTVICVSLVAGSANTGYSASGSSSDHETEKVKRNVSQTKRKPPTGRKPRNSKPAKLRKLSTSSDDSCKQWTEDVAIVPQSLYPSSDDSSMFYVKPLLESAGPERTRLVCRSDHSDHTDCCKLEPVPVSQFPTSPLVCPVWDVDTGNQYNYLESNSY